MRTLRLRGIASLLLLSLVTAPPLGATLVVKLDLEELIQKAELILEARAIESHCLWIDGNLFTRVTLEPHQILKGAAGEEVIVLLPGGEDPNRRVPIATVWVGQPRLFLDHNYLLFLDSSDPRHSYYTVVGFSQGSFQIAYDPGGQVVAVQDLRGLRRQTPDGELPGERSLRSLAEIESAIRRSLGQDSAREVR